MAVQLMNWKRYGKSYQGLNELFSHHLHESTEQSNKRTLQIATVPRDIQNAAPPNYKYHLTNLSSTSLYPIRLNKNFRVNKVMGSSPNEVI
jgi:hypothetical protein